MTWTEGRRADYLRECKKIIDRTGWMIQGVLPVEGGQGPVFGYTVGMTPAGLPELVCSGLPPEDVKQVLNLAASVHLKAEPPFKHGDTLKDAESFSVGLRLIDAPRAEIGTATAMYGPKARALQLVWPDENGGWPTPAIFGGSARQELFGTPWW